MRVYREPVGYDRAFLDSYRPNDTFYLSLQQRSQLQEIGRPHLYTEAMLGVYELNRIELLRDVFTWAYKRSAARYTAVRQSLGEPDPFRMRHRTTLREIVASVVRGRMDKRQAAVHVGKWVQEHIAAQDRERFRETAERELLGLHEGNFARYRIKPSEFAAWWEVWER